jgi:hypothetical protein
VVVMIEHFSKWIELVPIPEKTSHHTAATLRGVLCRYGAPAEVLTDQEEFQGEFAELLVKLLIDHRLTSRDHPQSDGLAERMVQTVKEALWKFVQKSNRHHWDVQLCWIAMGYRTCMSCQNLLAGYSPCFLLFGRWPIVGTAIRKVYSKVVDLDDPKTWARVVRNGQGFLSGRCRSHSTTWRSRNTAIPYVMRTHALVTINLSVKGLKSGT